MNIIHSIWISDCSSESKSVCLNFRLNIWISWSLFESQMLYLYLRFRLIMFSLQTVSVIIWISCLLSRISDYLPKSQTIYLNFRQSFWISDVYRNFRLSVLISDYLNFSLSVLISDYLNFSLSESLIEDYLSESQTVYLDFRLSILVSDCLSEPQTA